MTKFDQKSFGIGAPKDNKYRDNWDSVFGKKEDSVPVEMTTEWIKVEPSQEELAARQERLDSLRAAVDEQIRAQRVSVLSARKEPAGLCIVCKSENVSFGEDRRAWCRDCDREWQR